MRPVESPILVKKLAMVIDVEPPASTLIQHVEMSTATCSDAILNEIVMKCMTYVLKQLIQRRRHCDKQ